MAETEIKAIEPVEAFLILANEPEFLPPNAFKLLPLLPQPVAVRSSFIECTIDPR